MNLLGLRNPKVQQLNLGPNDRYVIIYARDNNLNVQASEVLTPLDAAEMTLQACMGCLAQLRKIVTSGIVEATGKEHLGKIPSPSGDNGGK